MTFFERYIQGERAKVHEEIYALELQALAPAMIEDIHLVFDETFSRVKHNLSEIYAELRNLDYRFGADSYGEAEKPLVFAEADSGMLINQLEELTDPFRIPLSLKYFYRYITNCDFSWDWNNFPEIPWEGTDPIVIAPLAYLLDGATVTSSGALWISPDNLQKDNVSGDGYYLELQKNVTADTIITGYNLPFIEYLRLCFLHGGFPDADQNDDPGLTAFLEKMKSKLLLI